jgi:hypothetical protein
MAQKEENQISLAYDNCIKEQVHNFMYRAAR